jgi:DNA-binding NarL/FixJ family response regulator
MKSNDRKEGDAMRRIVINMQNSLFCNAIANTLRSSGNELEPYTVDTPDKVVDECKWLAPYALLMEVTGYTPWKLGERMKLRDAVKAQHPECKVVLIVDENAEREVAKQVKQAKKDGLIDQFIYGSISATYLADIVDSL